MADIRSNFIAGKMNKSVDERLVPPGEYVDALNVRLGSTETTEIGAVENSKGNTRLSFLSYNGSPLSEPADPAPPTTFCIGSFEDGMNETIYWFIHDSNNPLSTTGKVDMIVSFNTNNNTTTYHVVSVDDGGGVNTTLNFDPKFLVTGVNKIEDLLFFTDDKNAPRTINVKRNYDDPVAGVDGIVEEDISVIVKPPGFETPAGGNIPLPVPTVQPEMFPGDENYMETRFLSFAYRYRYTDGGYSATSLFTNAVFEPGPFRFDLTTFNNGGMVNKYNGATIGFSTGSKRVVQVDLLYKESTSNTIYVIERYNKADLGWSDNIQQTIVFTNSKIFTVLGSDELLRQYDNVPRTAKAQTIQGNRLIYGNYVDGYDIVNQNGQKIPISYRTDHEVQEVGGVALDTPVASNGIAYAIGQPGGGSVLDSLITFDLSALTFPIQPGLTLNFDISLQSAPSTGAMVNPQSNGGVDVDTSFQQTSPFSVTWSFTANQIYNTMNDLVNSTEFQNPIGTTAIGNYQPLVPTNLSGQGGTVTDKFNNYMIAPPATSLDIVNSAIDSGACAAIGPPATSVCIQQGFRYTPTAIGFSIQAPAITFYSESAPGVDVSIQYEFFSFIDFSSTAGYLLVSNTLSLHSNRDYETAIVYMDDYGRASTALVANDNTIFVPPSASPDKNTIRVTLSNLPPYWATKYKFVVKPSEGLYQTLYSSQYYEDPEDASVFWFKLEGDNTNIAQTGMNLIIKMDTLGPINQEEICKILEIKAYGAGDLLNPGSLAGLYMSIKPGGFNTEIGDDANINYGNKSSKSNSTSCNLSNSYSLNFPSSSTNTGPYDLPAGSTIRVVINNWRGQKGNNCTDKHYRLDRSWISSIDYPNFYRWWYGDNRDMTDGSSHEMACQQFLNSGSGPYATSGSISAACFTTRLFCYGDETAVTGDLKFRNRCGIPRCSSFWGDKRPGHVGTKIEITRGGQLIVWETEPEEVDPNLFYDASEMMDIYTDPADSQRYHKSSGGSNTDQSSVSSDLIQTLAFGNCFTFGNGVESFRITDSPATKYMVMGQRVTAVSNQDYKEADRFAGMTYSGVYSGAANSNNLNEFNLGLVNYKDCEPSFGPIQLLYSRETDILTLQEDRISYVLASKNVITDSTGGGAIASVPEVLGTQVARIEEYGISFNPESFAAWGADMFFTDTKRSSVINLRGTSRGNDQIQIISSYGMRSWFRDQFITQLGTQKIGGFDPYMNEYVISTNDRDIPTPAVGTACGTNLTQVNATNVLAYTVNLGQSIGQINIPYTVTSGSILVEATWNSTVFSSGVVNSSGTLSFQKTTNTPNDVEIKVTPQGTASYGITVDCPPSNDLTVIRIVLNSPSDSGKFIHYRYNWADGTTISPVTTSLASLTQGSPSEYISQTGQASVGSYPYSGSTINMSTSKQGFDDYDFDPLQDKLRLLSSNALYPNTPAGMNLLLQDPNLIDLVPILNPSTGVYESSILTTGVNMPPANNYLYLVWDLRETTQSQLCYSAATVSDVCCGNCSPVCTTTWFGPVQVSETLVCNTDTNSPGSNFWSFHGTGSIPQVGEVCYQGTACDISQHVPPGYYIVSPVQPSAAPKIWIQVGANGAVIASDNC